MNPNTGLPHCDSRELMKVVADQCGIEPKGRLQKITIVLEVGCAPRIYTKSLISKGFDPGTIDWTGVEVIEGDAPLTPIIAEGE